MEYVKENKFWYKESFKSYQNKESFINDKGEIVTKEFIINTGTNFSKYPYIDTFSFGGNGFLTNVELPGNIYQYNRTNGIRYEMIIQFRDQITGLAIDENDAYQINAGEMRYRNLYTHEDNIIIIGTDVFYKNDTTIVKVGKYWYEKNDPEIIFSNGIYKRAA